MCGEKAWPKTGAKLNRTRHRRDESDHGRACGI
jgi:hypothetical protein